MSVVFDLEAVLDVSFLAVSFFLAVFFFAAFFVSVSVFLAVDFEVLEEVSVDAVLDEEPVDVEVVFDEEPEEVEACVVVAFLAGFFLAVDCFAAPPPGFARQNAFTFAPLERTCAAT